MFDMFSLSSMEGKDGVEANKRIVQSIKDNNKKMTTFTDAQLNISDNADVMVKMARIRTKSMLSIQKSFADMIRISKDDRSNVDYTKVKSKEDANLPSNTANISSKDSKDKSGWKMPAVLAGSIASVASLVGKIALPLAAVYGMIDGWGKAADYFNTDYPDLQQKISSGLGRTMEIISFGWLDAKKMSQNLDKSFTVIASSFGMFSEWLDKQDWYKDIKGEVKEAAITLGGTDFIQDANKIVQSTAKQMDGFWKTDFFGDLFGVKKDKLKEVIPHIKGGHSKSVDRYTGSQLNKFNDMNGTFDRRDKAYQGKIGSGITILPDGTALVGGSKSWRNNNPGNITGMGGLRYGAAGVARTSTGDRGDQKQLVFNTYEDGVRAFDKLIDKNYSKGSIKDEFYKYQSDKKSYRNKMANMEKEGIDTNRSIAWYKDNDKDKYQKFREIMFKHEGYIPGQIANVKYKDSEFPSLDSFEKEVSSNPIKDLVTQQPRVIHQAPAPSSSNTRKVGGYALDTESVIEFKTRLGVD